MVANFKPIANSVVTQIFTTL